MLEHVSVGAAVALCTAAVVTDIRSLRIYNWLTMPALITGLVWRLSMFGLEGLLDGLAGVLIAFFVLLLPFIMGAMGAGDVKLMSALGAWLGFGSSASIVLVACLLTGVASVMVLVRRGGLSEAWLNMRIAWYRILTLKNHIALDQPDQLRAMKADPNRSADLIPFSIMILLALLLVFLFQVQNNLIQ